MRMKRFLAVLLTLAFMVTACGAASADIFGDLGDLAESVFGGGEDEFAGEDLKTRLDAVEAFFDEYCAFMTKYAKNPEDVSLLADYATMMGRYAAAESALDAINEDELTEEEYAYYSKVMARIAEKLAATGLSMAN